MSTWKKVALLNVSGLFGIGLSLFMVPPQIPLWIWASLSVLCLAVFNLFLDFLLAQTTLRCKVEAIRWR